MRIRAAGLLSGSVALLWAGIVIGVSVLATPVKFAAPSLSLGVALEVGHVTFHLLNRVEWGLALLLVLAVLAARQRLLWLMAGAAVAVVALQTFWLLPVLDVRTAAVIAGEPVPPSHYHLWYIAAEAAKIAALLAVAAGALRRVTIPQ